jgi:hypothetical protein
VSGFLPPDVSSIVAQQINGNQLLAELALVLRGVSVATGSIGYAQLPASLQQVPIAFPFTGVPAAGEMQHIVMASSISIPAVLAGSQVYDVTPPTANAVFTFNRIRGGVTTLIGTVTITPATNTSAVLAGPGASLIVGDVLQRVAPAVEDPTLADGCITLMALRA